MGNDCCAEWHLLNYDEFWEDINAKSKSKDDNDDADNDSNAEKRVPL